MPTTPTVSPPPSPLPAPTSATRPRTRGAAVPAALLAAVLSLVLTLPGCALRDDGPDPVALPPASAPAATRDPAAEAGLARYYRQSLTWRDCLDGAECTRLTVPVDWADPAGDTLTLAVARQRASGRRLGSLLFNPGGPGVSVLQYVQAYRQVAGNALRRHFDFVGFDPRGVGESSPVRCLPDGELESYVSGDQTPDDAAEREQVEGEVTAFGRACEQNTGKVLRHVDTASAARDLDVLRAVLGDARLTYWGASYGTYLGAWYAHLFPWRVGRMVLDGAVDPALDAASYIAGQAGGFDQGLRAYLRHCLDGDDCAFRGSLDDALAALGRLVAAADTTPLQAGDGRRLTQSLMVTGIAQGLYDDGLWDRLDEALGDARRGDGEGLLALADLYLERDAQGHYGQTLAANPAIFCLDHPERRDDDRIAADAEELQRRYPPLGGSIAWGALQCAHWPVPAVLEPGPLRADGAAPILVVGTVGDPATPYAWAQALARELGSGRLLTWEGQGHTAYRRGGHCVDDAVEGYLVTGTLPADGTRCPA